jgi:hypothetical protein
LFGRYDGWLRGLFGIEFFGGFPLVLLNCLTWLRNPVDNVGDGQVPTNRLQIVLDGTFPKYALEDTSNEVHHYDVILLLQNLCKLGKNGHSIVSHFQLRDFRDGSAFLLYVLPEFRDQREDWVAQDVRRDVIMSFPLIPDVNQTVVNSHLELCR